MPTVDENLYSAAQARVGGRLYPVTAPQSPTAPYGVYQRVAGVANTDLVDGKGVLMRSRYQVDIWADDRAAAQAIAELIAGDLCSSSAFKAVRETPPLDFGFEEETSLYRVTTDFSIAHN